MDATNPQGSSRRDFLAQAGLLAGAAALIGPAAALAAPKKAALAIVDVTPPEDLMREHGVLRRLLLIYDDLRARLQAGQEFPLAALTGANDIIRRFIQDYHEKDEEDYLFTRFKKAGKMVDLVKVLYAQHQAGRKVMTQLQGFATAANLQQPAGRQKIGAYLEMFTRMYRPHAAREDTVLYPAFRSVISPQEFADLSDTFEDKEHKLFGENGFENIVAQVAALEQKLGLYELTQFTPKV
jgi:hemerythrin-like domain-containing protein